MLQQIQNCFFSAEQLENTASRKDGVDQDTEDKLRIYGCEIIQHAGILLKLYQHARFRLTCSRPQVCMATAQVLFHRFYTKQSFKRYNLKHIAPACLFLASKLEEAKKKTKDILNVFHYIYQVHSGKEPVLIDQISVEYIEMKDNIIKAETKMLNEMGFLVYVEHPHKFIPKYLQSLGRDEESLMQIAWNYANDSLRTPLCLKFPPEAIATGCVALTARKVGLALPDELRWWELFDTKESQVDEVAWTILQLYKQPKAKYISLRLQAQAANEVKEIESRSRSKSRGSSQERGKSHERRRERSSSNERSRSRGDRQDPYKGRDRGDRRDGYRDRRGDRDRHDRRDERRDHRDRHDRREDRRDDRRDRDRQDRDRRDRDRRDRSPRRSYSPSDRERDRGRGGPMRRDTSRRRDPYHR